MAGLMFPNWRDGLPTHCSCGEELHHECRSRARKYCSLKCWSKAASATTAKANRQKKAERILERWPNGVPPMVLPSGGQVSRFWSFVEKSERCWKWTGKKMSNGYGYFEFKTTGLRFSKAAHRIAYALSGLDIPDGLDLDHICRVRECVNPSHLEPVTRSENLRRGHAARRLEHGHV